MQALPPHFSFRAYGELSRALRTARAGWLVVAQVALLVCACEAGKREPRSVLTVFAASSLKEPFEELERGFERLHPEHDVRLSFAGTQVLRFQVEQGAPADVLAAADEEHMAALVAAGRAGSSQVFARNQLALIVPAANPAGIQRFSDLVKAQRLVVGADGVPVGRYTARLFELSRATLGQAFFEAVQGHVVSKEDNVRLVRTKVQLGEADAAIVYETDARASPELQRVPIPAEFNVFAHYPIAALTASQVPQAAEAFVGYVLSAEGQGVLRAHGFLSPVPP